MSTIHRIQSPRNFAMILLANAILGSAMPMLIVLGGLAGLMLAPSPGLTTFPPTIQMLAGVLVTAPVSLLMGRVGRKNGFVIGAIFAFFGGICGAIALFEFSFWLLCLAHVLLGTALASFGYFRFAAGEVVPEKSQPIAISLTLGSGLIAAFVGPEIFIQTKDVFQPVPFAGAYLAIAGIALIGSVPVLCLKWPLMHSTSGGSRPAPVAVSKILRRPPVLIAVTSAAVSGGVMMLLMTPTPLAMIGCGYSDASAGDVIRWHVVAMFAPSFFTGFLIKRFGALSVIAIGMTVLAAAAGIAIMGISLPHFYGSLILLGLGWNFGFIGATSLLTSVLKPEERAAIQGTNDTLVAMFSALASFASGAVVSRFGWDILAMAAFPVLAMALAMLVLSRGRKTGVSASEST